MDPFYPDNPLRQQRLNQLASDTQNFLQEAKSNYIVFHALVSQLNAQLAQVYAAAKLTPPAVSPLTILQTQQPNQEIAYNDTVIEISELVLSISGVVATATFFGPAATAVLVENGIMTQEVAGDVLFSVLGAEFTVGVLVGGMLGGLVVGAVIAAIGALMDLIEGAQERQELEQAILQAGQLRALMKFSLDRSTCLLTSLQAVQTACAALLASPIGLTQAMITNLVNKSARPALLELNTITPQTVNEQLMELDFSRHSWTEEDISPNAIDFPQVPYISFPPNSIG